MWLYFAIILVLVCFLILRNLNYWKNKGIPYAKPLPIVGNIGENVLRIEAIVNILDNIYKKYSGDNRYTGCFFFTQPVLLVFDPDLIKKITVKDFEVFPEHRPFIPEGTDPLWTKNLFGMRGGERWHDLRSTLSPSFTSSKMKMMFELIQNCALQFADHFEKKGDSVEVELKDAFTRFANDVIATTAFGISCDSLSNPNNEFYLMGKEATDFTGSRSLGLLLQAFSPALAKLVGVRIFTNRVRTFFSKIIQETIQAREQQGIVRPDMIHLLLEARKGRTDDDKPIEQEGFAVVGESDVSKAPKKQKAFISDLDITAQAMIFFFAGFDTVSTMMSYACYELALNPDIQDRLRREILEALEENNGVLTYDLLMKMKYLDMVLTETMRKWPPFAIMDRHSIKPYTITPEKPGEKPVHLDSNTVLFIPIYSIQRDPKYYPNPDKFDPDRFSDENKHTINPFTYLPFGVGPRNCIGNRFALLEVKAVMVQILKRFELLPTEKTPIPIVFTKKVIFPIPEKGIWLKMKLLKSS